MFACCYNDEIENNKITKSFSTMAVSSHVQHARLCIIETGIHVSPSVMSDKEFMEEFGKYLMESVELRLPVKTECIMKLFLFEKKSSDLIRIWIEHRRRLYSVVFSK